MKKTKINNRINVKVEEFIFKIKYYITIFNQNELKNNAIN